MKTKTSDDVFKTIETLSGGKIEITMCRGRNVFNLLMMQVVGGEAMHPAEMSLQLMIDLCRVEGKKQDKEFYFNLLSEDYCKLSEIIGVLIQNFGT